MAKRKTSQASKDLKAQRGADRAARIASGVKQRPVTFPDRRAKARKAACRGRVTPE